LRTVLFLTFLFFAFNAGAQTLGGRSVYNFLKMPATPMLTAAGGVNVSLDGTEVGLTANNPALLKEELKGQLQVAFNSFPGAFKTYSLTTAFHHEKSGTDLGAHIFFLDYGTIPQTDASGNDLGSFRPRDFVVQFSAAR
jgi:hypothetical protein